MICYREVWWCWILNEPFVVEFDGDNAVCTCCKWKQDAKSKEWPEHRYIVTISALGKGYRREDK